VGLVGQTPCALVWALVVDNRDCPGNVSAEDLFIHFQFIPSSVTYVQQFVAVVGFHDATAE
jgi:hypothetical protein